MKTETIFETREATREEPTIIEVGAGQSPIQHHESAPASGRDTQHFMPSHSVASQSLVQMFGLDFRAAFLVILVDLMVFTGDVASLGAFLPFAICIAGALGFITYKIQKHWYGDDQNSALIKSMIVGLLTAIPAPLTPLIAIPGGIVGIVKLIRRK